MELINKISGMVWGPVLIILLVGTGLYLSVGTGFIQFRKIGLAFKLLFSKENKGDGDITPFQSLMTSLAATIGTGNIVGVSSAIVSGGPGAVFWMWMTAAVGGASKYGEAVLAIKYRETNEEGERSGGPMYYIEKGLNEKLGGNWKWLGMSFAIFAFIASFGIGNMAQSNSIANALHESFHINKVVTGVILAVLVGFVIIGGIQSIAKMSEKIVPLMALFYIVGCFIVLFMYRSNILSAFQMIFENAFSGNAVKGGLIGSVIRFGVARGVFSNEAGLGSAPIAHAASKNNNPITQGLIGSLGSFIDTIIICSMTAIVILASGLVKIGNNGAMSLPINPSTGKELDGARLTVSAFNDAFANVNIGSYIVAIGLVFFAFSTILGWYYYGAKSLEYLAGVKTVFVYKIVYIILVFVGSIQSLDVVFGISDIFNGLMAIPNLIALILLSPLIFSLTKKYERGEDVTVRDGFDDKNK